MSSQDAETRHALTTACHAVGLDAEQAELVRLGENAIYRLPGRVIARIGRRGQFAAAIKEANIARWLELADVPAVQVIPDVDQPVDVDGRPVTFWRELPPHDHGTPAQVARALWRLHAIPRPTTFELPELEPFVRLDERINSANSLATSDRSWMRAHLAELRDRYQRLPEGLPPSIIHGDAWTGNVVSISDGHVVFLDLERAAFGPPEWDLVHTAIKHSSFGWITADQYHEFREIYGHDVTDWDGYTLLRDIREFRMTCMAAQIASQNPAQRDQAAHRLACIRGSHGHRPWDGWAAVP